MDNNVKVCKSCSTINSADAGFCRECGQPLEQVSESAAAPIQSETPTTQPYDEPQPARAYQSPVPPTAPVQSPYGYGYTQPQPGEEFEIAGVKCSELAAFVGPKAEHFMPKFIKKAQTGKKVGFNALVFLLGFLLSPLIASFWFFHRRMNKIGAILLCIGIVLFAGKCVMLNSTLNEFESIIKIQFSASSSDNYGSFSFSEGEFEDFFRNHLKNSLTESEKREIAERGVKMVSYALIISLIQLISAGVAIGFAMMADHLYLKHCIAGVYKVREQNPSYTTYDLSCAGGTKATIWVILMVVFILFSISYCTIMAKQFITTILQNMNLELY